jgi:hypothetical protein
MSVIYDVALKTQRMNANKTYFANGTLELQTAAGTALAVFTLQAAAGSVTGAVWTLTPFASATVTASGGGTLTKAVIKTSTALAHITGLTVGTSSADIILDTTTVANGQSVTLTSATITHA